ncbi:MAG: 30S ribosomal protein S4e [Candidatus Thermoplasmatota archaeon]|jgi:small subunit ribosomal protein S4e|nr:30S ribosomal protein S4e [Candidatus Thermoplasmatota archaeon]MCL5786215.1 30S ribosomal protein S4e [Candidatus Thermoplasmatota archaeon]
MTINKTKTMMVSPAVHIRRKVHFWSVTPRPGKHASDRSVAILIVLRDYLRIGDKEREITRILNSGSVKVDGKVVKDRRTSLGFMDLVSISENNSNHRILYDRKGRLIAVPDEEHKDSKLVKVTHKTSVGKGKFMITFHDGQNILVEDNSIRPNDVLVILNDGKKIDQILKLAKGSKVFMIGGSHVGETGTVKEIEVKASSQANLVTLEEGFSTTVNNVFVVGNSKYNFNVTAGSVS